MKTALATIALISVFICQSTTAEPNIDLLMRAELAESDRVGLTLIEYDNDGDFNIPLVGRAEDMEYKSRTRAALYSLILPGAGQHYIDNVFTSRLFFGVEALSWLSYFGFRKYGAFKDEAARGWAVLRAGANPFNDDNRYWLKMTYYDNRDRNTADGLGYNQMAAATEREQAILFPTTPEYYWDWDGRDDRQKYRNLRNQSKTAYKRADVIVGVIIANHVISAAEAYFAAGKYNRRLEFSGIQIYYSFKPDLENPAVAIGLTRHLN